MSKISEAMQTYWTKKWAERHGLDIKYADRVLKLIGELTMETDYDEDVIEAVVLASFPTNPLENIFEKFMKVPKGKDAGKLVKFCRYREF